MCIKDLLVHLSPRKGGSVSGFGHPGAIDDSEGLGGVGAAEGFSSRHDLQQMQRGLPCVLLISCPRLPSSAHCFTPLCLHVRVHSQLCAQQGTALPLPSAGPGQTLQRGCARTCAPGCGKGPFGPVCAHARNSSLVLESAVAVCSSFSACPECCQLLGV